MAQGIPEHASAELFRQRGVIPLLAGSEQIDGHDFLISEFGFWITIVRQVSNYYPFGMEYGESAEDQTEMTYQDYQFGGKEFERDFELNMYDFGARNYDGSIGRWTTIDPLAEDYYENSPYTYCLNSPVNHIDPDGRGVDDINPFPEITVTAKRDDPVGTRAMNPVSGFWGYVEYITFVGKAGTFLKLRSLAKGTGPAVILTKSEHQVWTMKLREAMPYGESYTKDEIIKRYTEVYKDQPEWLKLAIDYISN